MNCRRFPVLLVVHIGLGNAPHFSTLMSLLLQLGECDLNFYAMSHFQSHVFKWSTSCFTNVASFFYVFCASWMNYFIPIWFVMVVDCMIVWKKWMKVFLKVWGTFPCDLHVSNWQLWCHTIPWVGFLGYLWIFFQ